MNGAPEQKKLYRRPGFVASVFLILAVLPVIVKVLTIPTDSRIAFLTSHGNAQWIDVQRPFLLKGKWGGEAEAEAVTYRKRFTLKTAAPGAVLTVQALRSATVMIDGKVVLPYDPDLKAWKHPRSVDVGTMMTPGDHGIVVLVVNKMGPACLLVSSKDLGLYSGEDWEATDNGTTWRPAMLAEKTKPMDLPVRFPTIGQALLSLAPLYAFLFLGIFFFTIWSPRLTLTRRWTWPMVNPSMVRWLLIGLWTVLAANNIMKLSLELGYDVQSHYDYIAYVSRTWSVPLATQGWQMFQSPLYYFVSAILSVPLSLLFTPVTVSYLLRIVPLACGILQVEVSYRAARCVFPNRDDLQIIGTVLGGLLPMNIYISQYVGNEPLAGLLSGSALVMMLMLLRKQAPPTVGQWLFLGTLLGLALLTKVTAVLLVLPLMLLLYTVSNVRDGERTKPLSAFLFVSSAALAFSGWYYVRNWLALGTPFLGGWESQPWWQDPGYRTIHDFFSFGTSLWQPVYSGIHGFWDSLYSTFWFDGFLGSADLPREMPPPWNYQFMLSGVLFSLVPAAAIVTGTARAIARPYRSIADGTLLCAVSVLFYGAVLLYLYISLPIYSTAKATYTLGLIPCYVVLCLYGLEPVFKHIYVRAAIYAVFVCWAVSAYVSFFIW
jgi:hypothetical protein